MELITAPVRFVVWHPERIAGVGATFLVLLAWCYYVRRQIAWPAVIAALAWFAFAGWESLAKANRWDIRVDLVLIAPVLFSVTIYGMVGPFRRRPIETRDAR